MTTRMHQVLNTWNEAVNQVPGSTRPRRLPFLKELMAATATEAKPRDEQNWCRPWSREYFNVRVRTFKSWTWFAKPEQIGPLNCARLGWVNDGQDMLKCESCGASLCFRISETLGLEAAQELVTKFGKQLAEGHKECCPWKNNPSPKSFTDFSSETNSTFFTDFKARTSRLRLLAQLAPLPELAPASITRLNVVPPALGTSEGRLSQLLSAPSIPVRAVFGSEGAGGGSDGAWQTHWQVVEPSANPAERGAQQRAVCLALGGWDVQATEQELQSELAASAATAATADAAAAAAAAPRFLFCSFCQRKIGLWNFATAEGKPFCMPPSGSGADADGSSAVSGEGVGAGAAEADSGGGGDGGSAKRQRTLKPFDVLTEHKWFCPWVTCQHVGATVTVAGKGARAAGAAVAAAGVTAAAAKGPEPEAGAAAVVAVASGWERCLAGVLLHISSRLDRSSSQGWAGSRQDVVAGVDGASLDPKETLTAIRKLLGSA